MNARNSVIVSLAIGLTAFLLPSLVLWVLLILIPLVIAHFGVFETVKTGRMKFHIQGQSYLGTIKTNSARDPFQFFIWKIFKKHFFGWSFFNHAVKSFDINTDIENPRTKPGDTTTWRIVREEPRKVKELWEEVPRILTLYNVEIGGENPLQISMRILIVLRVSERRNKDGLDGGARFVFVYNSDFGKPEDLITTAIIKKIAKECKTYKDVIDAPPQILEDLKFDSNLVEDLNEFGFELKIIKINDVATDKSLEDVYRKKTVALAENEVKILNAETEAKAILIVAEAEAKGLTLKEIAQTQTVIKVFEENYPGLSAEQRIDKVAELLKFKEVRASQITHWITDLFKI